MVTEAFIAEILVSVLEFSVEPAGETFARTHNCTNENERSSMMAAETRVICHNAWYGSIEVTLVDEERERYEGVVFVPLSKGLFYEQMNEVATTERGLVSQPCLPCLHLIIRTESSMIGLRVDGACQLSPAGRVLPKVRD